MTFYGEFLVKKSDRHPPDAPKEIRRTTTTKMEADCNMILSQYNFQYKVKEKQVEVISSILKKQDTFAFLSTSCGKSTCHVLPPLNLDKVRINIDPVPKRLPVNTSTQLK